MNAETKIAVQIALCSVTFLAVLILPIVFCKWKQCIAQAAVYERQGVHATAEELFWGAKPIVPTYQSSKVDLIVEQR